MQSKQDVTHCPHEPQDPGKCTCTEVIVPAPSAPQASLASLKKFLIFSFFISHSCSRQSACTYIQPPAFFKLYLLPDSDGQRQIASPSLASPCTFRDCQRGPAHLEQMKRDQNRLYNESHKVEANQMSIN